MSTSVAIERLSATLHAPEDAGAELPRVDRVLRYVAGGPLREALQDAALPAGLWFVPRLDLRLDLDLAAPEPTLARRWSRAVAAAVASSLRDPAVVRYADDVQLLADAVTGVAAGRTARLWAWSQAGLVQPGDPGTSTEPGALLVAMLRRRPEHAVPALAVAADVVGVARLDRALGRRGWSDVVGLVAGGADAAASAARLLSGEAAHHRAADTEAPGDGSASDADASSDGAPRMPAGSQAPAPSAVSAMQDQVERLARTLAAGSPLAAAFARVRLRPDPATLAAWAVLVVADADPSALRRPAAGELVAAVSRVLAGGSPSTVPGLAGPGPVLPPLLPGASGRAVAAGAVSTSRPSPSGPPSAAAHASSSATDGATSETGETGASGRPVPSGEGAARDATASGAEAPRDRAAAPGVPAAALHEPAGSDAADPDDAVTHTADLDEPDEPGLPTAWAGLPFLLATAPLAGLPDRVLDDPALAARPLRWVLHRAGTRLVPVAPDDPALLPLSGTDADRAGALLAAAPAEPAEEQAVDRLARDWAAVTAARYLSALPDPPPADVPRDPALVVARIAARRGEVVARRGWIDVRLRLADVDTTIRRAGLDLDPGWVTWLGTVVRYLYE